jgi:hypothetical protein
MFCKKKSPRLSWAKRKICTVSAQNALGILNSANSQALGLAGGGTHSPRREHLCAQVKRTVPGRDLTSWSRHLTALLVDQEQRVAHMLNGMYGALMAPTQLPWRPALLLRELRLRSVKTTPHIAFTHQAAALLPNVDTFLGRVSGTLNAKHWRPSLIG